MSRKVVTSRIPFSLDDVVDLDAEEDQHPADLARAADPRAVGRVLVYSTRYARARAAPAVTVLYSFGKYTDALSTLSLLSLSSTYPPVRTPPPPPDRPRQQVEVPSGIRPSTHAYRCVATPSQSTGGRISRREIISFILCLKFPGWAS